MIDKDLMKSLIRGIAPVIRAEIIKRVELAIEPLQTQIADLRSQLAEERERPRGLAYQGTWQRAAFYHRHDGVTWGGQVWVCVVDKTQVQPGEGAAWQLAVRKGTDGKDAR